MKGNFQARFWRAAAPVRESLTLMFQYGCVAYPKKTVKQIIDSGNDYLIAVKANQPTLFKHLQSQFEQTPPSSVDCQTQHTRDRQTQRTVSVLDTIAGIDPEWVGVQRLIRVQREGTRDNKPFGETVFYISSLTLDAPGLAAQIQQHWHIENRLHWPKDAVLKEDEAPLCDGYAPANESHCANYCTKFVSSCGFCIYHQGASTLIS